MRWMAGVLSVGGILFLASDAALAQGWPPWAQELFGPSYEYEPRRQLPEPRSQRERRDSTNDVREGGARPSIAPVAPPLVKFQHNFPANSIVIDTGGRKLYYVLGDNRAYAYAIGVGRDGFSWTGTEKIGRKQAWPDWYPPAEMRERDPRLPVKMTGGLRNPLGATALYLGDTLYRIHGTNDPKSIGRAESSGCFRMLNSNVLHLASIAEVGTPVAVITSLSKREEVNRARAAVREAIASRQPKDAAPVTANQDQRSAPAAASRKGDAAPAAAKQRQEETATAANQQDDATPAAAKQQQGAAAVTANHQDDAAPATAKQQQGAAAATANNQEDAAAAAANPPEDTAPTMVNGTLQEGPASPDSRSQQDYVLPPR
jgi:lipoprotein-anchoring transpeptidase ErfK/SrfK